MADLYRDCLVCGKTFKACNTCKEGIDETLQWRRVVCCPEHFSYHFPIIQYSRGKIDKATAKSELQQAIDTYGQIDFCDNIKGIVNEILGDDEVKTVVDEPMETTNIVEEAVQEGSNCIDYNTETTTSKKKRKAKDYE